MNQQQIDIARIQTLQRFLYCVRLLVKGRPQLGLQKNLIPGNTGFLNRAPYRFFVHIGISTPLFNFTYFCSLMRSISFILHTYRAI